MTIFGLTSFASIFSHCCPLSIRQEGPCQQTYRSSPSGSFSTYQKIGHVGAWWRLFLSSKNGYIPLKTCQRKCGKKCSMTCKYDFPKTRLCIHKSMLVCRGVARKYKLQLTGRRNTFASILGKRKCEWQSGTTPAFAVAFRSNTHVTILESTTHSGMSRR